MARRRGSPPSSRSPRRDHVKEEGSRPLFARAACRIRCVFSRGRLAPLVSTTYMGEARLPPTGVNPLPPKAVAAALLRVPGHCERGLSVAKVGIRGRWANGVAPFAHKVEEGRAASPSPGRRPGGRRKNQVAGSQERRGPTVGSSKYCNSDSRVPACPSNARGRL